MAVVGTVTAGLASFPVRVQRKALEPDGIAFAELVLTGDGSGGNILHTIRAPSSHFYMPKALSYEVDGSTGPGNIELRQVALGVAELTGFATGNFHQVFGASESASGRHITNTVNGFMPALRWLPLGSFRAIADASNDILSANQPINTTGQTYTFKAYFYAYRLEALTAPGVLENLLAPGIVR